MAVRDATLSRIEDITEDEANITRPLNLPSTTSMSTSSSEYTEMAGRLLRYRSRAYRKRLSRSIEQISASSTRSTQSAQNPEDEVSDDNDSLASDNVFGSKDDQILFFKQTLIDMNKKLESYQEINADLGQKLENCRIANRSLKKQLGEVLFSKYKLLNKYENLKQRFNVSTSNESDSPSSDSAPGNGGRPGTPVRRPKKRGGSPGGSRDAPGPSKRPTIVRCGLERQDSATNSSEERIGAPSSDPGCSVADFSHSAEKNCYSESEGSSSSSVSQSPVRTNQMDDDEILNDGFINPDIDDALRDNEEDDVCSRDTHRTTASDDDERDSDGKADEERSVLSSKSSSSISRKRPSSSGDDERDSDGKADEERSVQSSKSSSSISRKRPSSSGDDGRDSDGKADEERSVQSSKSSSSISRKRPSSSGDDERDSDGKADEERSVQSSKSSSSISRKRPSSSGSLSDAESDAGTKRRRSSSPSSESSASSHSDSSCASSDSSVPTRRSQSRSPSPVPFRDAPGVIPGAPIPAGTSKLPRFWHRDGNDVRRRCSKGKKRGGMDGAFTWMAGDSWRAGLHLFLFYTGVFIKLFLLAYNLIL